MLFNGSQRGAGLHYGNSNLTIWSVSYRRKGRVVSNDIIWSFDTSLIKADPSVWYEYYSSEWTIDWLPISTQFNEKKCLPLEDGESSFPVKGNSKFHPLIFFSMDKLTICRWIYLPISCSVCLSLCHSVIRIFVFRAGHLYDCVDVSSHYWSDLFNQLLKCLDLEESFLERDASLWPGQSMALLLLPPPPCPSTPSVWRVCGWGQQLRVDLWCRELAHSFDTHPVGHLSSWMRLYAFTSKCRAHFSFFFLFFFFPCFFGWGRFWQHLAVSEARVMFKLCLCKAHLLQCHAKLNVRSTRDNVTRLTLNLFIYWFGKKIQ